MKWGKKPYKSVRMLGQLWTDKLLPPEIKQLFDLLHKNKSAYIGIVDENAYLYINNQPPIKVKSVKVDDVKELCPDHETPP